MRNTVTPQPAVIVMFGESTTAVRPGAHRDPSSLLFADQIHLADTGHAHVAGLLTPVILAELSR